MTRRMKITRQHFLSIDGVKGDDVSESAYIELYAELCLWMTRGVKGKSLISWYYYSPTLVWILASIRLPHYRVSFRHNRLGVPKICCNQLENKGYRFGSNFKIYFLVSGGSNCYHVTPQFSSSSPMDAKIAWEKVKCWHLLSNRCGQRYVNDIF